MRPGWQGLLTREPEILAREEVITTMVRTNVTLQDRHHEEEVSATAA
jgi:hypothetical protein